MNMTPRALPTLAFVLLAALATACGVEGNSDASSDPTVATATTEEAPVSTVTEPDSTTTEPDAPTTTEPDAPTTTEATDPGTDDLPAGFEEQFFKELVDGFVAAGLTQTQAECLADSYGQDILESGDTSEDSTADMMAYFAACDINPMDLGGG